MAAGSAGGRALGATRSSAGRVLKMKIAYVHVRANWNIAPRLSLFPHPFLHIPLTQLTIDKSVAPAPPVMASWRPRLRQDFSRPFGSASCASSRPGSSDAESLMRTSQSAAQQ